MTPFSEIFSGMIGFGIRYLKDIYSFNFETFVVMFYDIYIECLVSSALIISWYDIIEFLRTSSIYMTILNRVKIRIAWYMQRYIYNVFSLSSNSFEHKNTFKSFLNTQLGQLKTSIASSYYRWRIVKYLRPNKKPQCHIEFIVKVLLIYERIFWS